jgi:hypothetical protein
MVEDFFGGGVMNGKRLTGGGRHKSAIDQHPGHAASSLRECKMQNAERECSYCSMVCMLHCREMHGKRPPMRGLTRRGVRAMITL